MGIWSTLFNGSDTASKITDAIINTGDKLYYSPEEKAEDRQKQREHFPILLNAYSAFKVAQRILAIWFSFLFGLAFITGLVITVFNVIIIYTTPLVNDKGIAIIARQIPLEPLFALVTAFSLGTIVLVIVGFYFAGGTIESFQKKSQDK